MLFYGLEPRNNHGNPLPRDPNGVYQCNWNGDTSTAINGTPLVDDEGSPTDIRIEITIMDGGFYEFTGPDPVQLEHKFYTGAPFSFRFSLKKKSVDPTAPPCRLRSTVFFKVKDGSGKELKRQRTENIFIQ